MYVYLQAYEQGVPATEPLIAFVGLYRGQTKVMETQVIKVTEAWNNRLRTMPLQFSIPLKELTPGGYNLQVTVLDPTRQKAVFWQAPVVLVQ